MKGWLERALNVRPGDLGRGTLLCSCLFLIICSYKVGGVAGAALFLSRFQARQLAYADIASSVLVVAGHSERARATLSSTKPSFVTLPLLRRRCCSGTHTVNGQAGGPLRSH